MTPIGMKSTLLTSLFLLLYIAGYSQTTFTGRVVSIADGDTFTMLLAGNKALKVRLYGVDCPEKNQDFGTRARQFTSQLIFGKTVRVLIKDKDRYGRAVGVVLLPGERTLNEELLKNGMAWHYKAFDRSPRLALLESQARNRRSGLWSLKNPIAPWDFRKMGTSRRKVQRIPVPKNLNTRLALACGAPTETGPACRRMVKGGGYCYQHF